MAIYIQTGKVELAFGVSWMPEASNKAEQAAFVSKRNPNYSVTCLVAGTPRFGVARRTKIGKKDIRTFSAAFLFSEYLETSAKDIDTAILALKIRENDVAIVAILDGQIYRDEVVRLNAAEKTIAGLATETNRSFVAYSNLAILPDAIRFEIDSLDTEEQTTGELKPIRNFKKGLVVSLLLIVMILLAGLVGYEQYKKNAAEDEAARNRVDPVKAYTDSLEQSLANGGWSGLSAHDSHWLPIAANSISFSGWDLQTIECTRSVCVHKWKRINGTNRDFSSSYPKAKVNFKPDGTIESTLELKAVPTRLIAKEFPKSLDFQVLMASKDQDNKPMVDISGLTYQLTSPTIYALPAGTTVDQIPPSLAVLSGRISITVRLGMFAEVIRELPPNVAVSGFNIDLSGGPTGSKVTISGDYFVKP